MGGPTVSEYQYYEFLAIDRPLTKRQQAELRELSTRAEITSASFVNEYNWGDLRGSPEALMERYFDAFLYLANWGTRRLMFRVPRDAVDIGTAEDFCFTDAASITETDDHLIVNLYSDDESDDEWLEPGGLLAAMVQARADLATGDLRLLYLGWLLGIQADEADDEATEPSVPPGLNELTGSLSAIAEFLRIDEDLLAVAAAASPPLKVRDDSGLADWIAALPEAHKSRLLTRVAAGEGNAVQTQMVREYRAVTRPGTQQKSGSARTVLELWTAAGERQAQREAELARQERAERDRLDAARAAAYTKRLDDLVGRQEQVWERVDRLTDRTIQRDYDDAVVLLKDLRALADREGTATEFADRVRALRQQHQRKPSLLRRFDEADLPG
jgi:hypothetical protein